MTTQADATTALLERAKVRLQHHKSNARHSLESAVTADCVSDLLTLVSQQAEQLEALRRAQEQLVEKWRKEHKDMSGAGWGNDELITLGKSQCADELAAVLQQAERDEWQSIATAPKDGTLLLLWDATRKAVNVGYRDDSYLKPWHAAVHGDAAEWNDQGTSPTFDATHWMPLPAPPLTEADAGQET